MTTQQSSPINETSIQDGPVLNAFAGVVAHLRGISNKELSRHLNLEPYEISRVVLGHQRITSDMLETLSGLLQCPSGLLINPLITRERLLGVILRSAKLK